MRYHRRRGWEIPASETTPESIFLNRRAFVAGSAAALTAVALPRRARADSADPTAALYPAKRNPAYTLDRDVTPEAINLHYNNFYEFTTSKHVDADALKTRPWAVTIDGLVEKKGDHRRRRPGQGDRPRGAALPPPLRRSLVDGDPLDRLPAARAGRTGEAALGGQIRALRDLPRRYCRARPEAVHALALCRGPDDGRGDQRARLHRHRRLRQAGRQGAGRADPAGDAVEIRLQIGKSIVKISFIAERPETFWQQLGPDEYGFWANVNPEVPHPRWSQARETFLTTGEQRPTLIFNGYGE